MAKGQGKKKGVERRQLEEAFCQKIGRELEEFKEEALRMGKEEIFSIACRIDCMIRIYEMLAEHSGEFGEEELRRCIHEEGLLQSLYQKWLKSPALQEGELEHSVWSGIKETCGRAESETKEKKQKPLETEGKTAEKKQKMGGSQRETGTKRNWEPQKNGTQRKERFYGKADSDQKPAA